MKRPLTLTLLLTLVLTYGVPLSSYELKAQYDVSGLDLEKDVSTWFDDQFGRDQSQLVAGSYKKAYITAFSHPFFIESSWIKGSIQYRNQIFNDVDIIYNANDEYVIIKHPTNIALSSQPIKLEQNQIEWFEVLGHHFKNYRFQNNFSGFYDVLFTGYSIDFISKRSKKELIDAKSRSIEYKVDDSFYLMKKNELFLIRNKRSFIKVFPALKKEINEFVKNNRLTVKPDNVETMIQLTQHCDTIVSEQ
ncbi:MAG: hypothetical protein JXR07_05005 [Reichenbachiella sp.]